MSLADEAACKGDVNLQRFAMPEEESASCRPRPSASAEAALRAEIERVSRMTIEQRIIAALTLRERFAWIQPAEKTALSGDT